MCVYLRTKFQVSSIILTTFRQGVMGNTYTFTYQKTLLHTLLLHAFNSRRKGNQTIKYGQLKERAEYYSLENM